MASDSQTREALRSALVRLQEADEKACEGVLPALAAVPLGVTASAATAVHSHERRLGGVATAADVLDATGAAVAAGMPPVDLPVDRLATSVSFGSFATRESGGDAQTKREQAQAHKGNLVLQGLYLGTVDRGL